MYINKGRVQLTILPSLTDPNQETIGATKKGTRGGPGPPNKEQNWENKEQNGDKKLQN